MLQKERKFGKKGNFNMLIRKKGNFRKKGKFDMLTRSEFRYAHQMRDADISRMRKRLCETIVQVTAGIFFMRYAVRATVTLREDAKSSARSEKKMLVDWMQVCMDC
jgi:hypothetical protein